MKKHKGSEQLACFKKLQAAIYSNDQLKSHINDIDMCGVCNKRACEYGRFCDNLRGRIYETCEETEDRLKEVIFFSLYNSKS